MNVSRNSSSFAKSPVIVRNSNSCALTKFVIEFLSNVCCGNSNFTWQMLSFDFGRICHNRLCLPRREDEKYHQFLFRQWRSHLRFKLAGKQIIPHLDPTGELIREAWLSLSVANRDTLRDCAALKLNSHEILSQHGICRILECVWSCINLLQWIIHWEIIVLTCFTANCCLLKTKQGFTNPHSKKLPHWEWVSGYGPQEFDNSQLIGKASRTCW